MMNDSIDEEKPFEGRIFCLMGKSASGKDSVYVKVMSNLEKDGYEVEKLVMYTTRPQRAHEKDGGEYFFIDSVTMDNYDAKGLVIERRDYSTKYGIWSYAILDDGQINGNRNYLVIETPIGYRSMCERFGSDCVVPLYIHIDDGVLLMRALNREMQQDEPKYDEMCRRYLSDLSDFKDIGADESVARFANRDSCECAAQITSKIEEICDAEVARTGKSVRKQDQLDS